MINDIKYNSIDNSPKIAPEYERQTNLGLKNINATDNINIRNILEVS